MRNTASGVAGLRTPPNTRLRHDPSCPTRGLPSYRHPDHTKCAAVLEAVKDEPSVGADAPILDRFSARRLRIRVSVRVGTKKRALQVEQRN